MDACTDGFLIGVACSLSPSAGIVLGAANCLEMASLGIAYASSIKKCTAATAVGRTLALYIPPSLMLLFSGLGAFIGVLASSVPAVYIALVAFGVIALLALVCNELLIEAREAQGEEGKWYISILIFVGIYIILMMTGLFTP